MPDDNFKNFVALVQNMRAAQREYFRSRAWDSLEKCKKLEREVDAFIKKTAPALSGRNSWS